MNNKYEQLVKVLLEVNNDTVINIYFGDINGTYYSKSTFGDNLTIDNLISNGDLSMASNDHGLGYDVSNADYVCITTLKDGKDLLKPVLSKIDILFDDYKFLDFIEYVDVNNIHITNNFFDKCDFDNSVGYYEEDKAHGFKIFPSLQIIEKNKNKIVKKRKR